MEQAERAGYRFIGVEELSESIHARRNMILIDARPEPEFRRGHILGATNFCFPDRLELEPWSEASHGGASPEIYGRQLGRDPAIPVVIYAGDAASARSHQGAAWAVKLGFKKVSRCLGGLAAWVAAGEETRTMNE
jgi:rhodanese-related sulfurtransferase